MTWVLLVLFGLPVTDCCVHVLHLRSLVVLRWFVVQFPIFLRHDWKPAPRQAGGVAAAETVLKKAEAQFFEDLKAKKSVLRHMVLVGSRVRRL
jgi:hypothetical protein